MSVALKADDEYMKLVARFPLVPIKNARHYKQAFAVVNELTDDPESLSPSQIDYISVLSGLIHEYEQKTHAPIKRLSPQETLAYLMEVNNLSLTALADHIGGHKSNLSAFLSGKRGLSRTVADALAEHFGMDARDFRD